MNSYPRRFPDGSLRVSDAERDRALGELSDHYQAGRISAEEFDDRSGRALSAKTGRELSSLFDDLPPDRTLLLDPSPGTHWSARPVPDRTGARWIAGPVSRVTVPVMRIVVAVAIVAVLFGWISVSHRTAGLIVPLLLILLIVRRVVRSGR
jgi:Domain of unknown function (DUF1707)